RRPGMKIVAAVDIDGAALYPLADTLGRIGILRPDGGGEAIAAIVHQCDRLFVVADLSDADDGTKTLIAHHPHGVIDMGENLRREIRGTGPIADKGFWIDMGFRAPLDRLMRLRAHDFGEAGAGHRPERRRLIERIAEDILSGQLDETLHEGLVARFVDVDT